MKGEECRTGCSLSKLVSAELECKSEYLAAFMSPCVFVGCVHGCPLRFVYMSKFACNLVSLDEVGRHARRGREALLVHPSARRAWDL